MAGNTGKLLPFLVGAALASEQPPAGSMPKKSKPKVDRDEIKRRRKQARAARRKR